MSDENPQPALTNTGELQDAQIVIEVVPLKDISLEEMNAKIENP